MIIPTFAVKGNSGYLLIFILESIKIVKWAIIYTFTYSLVYVYYCLIKEFDKVIRENRSEIRKTSEVCH